MRGLGFVVASLVLAALSGCVDEKGDSQDTVIEIPSGFGAVGGLVLDEELQPVLAIIAALGIGESVSTDSAGRFELRLPIGSHTLEVQGLGFTSAQRSVDVLEGETIHVQILLSALPSDAPYVQVVTHTGFEACGLAAGGTGGTGETMRDVYMIPCMFGEPATSYLINVSESWRYTVLEMEWLSQDNMWFLATHQKGTCGTDGDAVCWAQSMGQSPLRLEGAPGSIEHAQKYALDGKKTFPIGTFDLILDTVYLGMFREEVNGTAGPYCATAISAALAPLGQSWNPSLGCGLGYGYSTGYKFNYYASIFHFAAPDDAAVYSARPDA